MKLVEYLKWKSLNVQKFADMIGISPLTIYRLIKGQDSFASTLFAIHDFTNGQVDWQSMRPTITRKPKQLKEASPVSPALDGTYSPQQQTADEAKININHDSKH